MNELLDDKIDFDLTYIMERRYFVKSFLNKIWSKKYKKVNS